MRFNILIKLVLVSVLGTSASNAQNYSISEQQGVAIPEMTVSTGGDAGTYFRFGTDIAKLASNFDINVQVKTSKGSPDNLNKLIVDKNKIHLGITQADVMDELISGAKKAEPKYRSLMNSLRQYKMVAPLYLEEIHIIARKDSGLWQISDLNSRIVSFGSPSSGHHTTASVLFRNLGIKPKKSTIEDTRSAIDAVLNNKIDAVIYVAGAPSGALNDHPRINELTLLDIYGDPKSQSYSKVQVDNRKYPWIDRSVNTLGVKALLVTTDYTGPICSAIGKLSCVIRENNSWFKEWGHPKWSEVNGAAFAAQHVEGWPVSDCVRDYLARGESCSVNQTIINPANARTVALPNVCNPVNSEYNWIACGAHMNSEALFNNGTQ